MFGLRIVIFYGNQNNIQRGHKISWPMYELLSDCTFQGRGMLFRMCVFYGMGSKMKCRITAGLTVSVTVINFRKFRNSNTQVFSSHNDLRIMVPERTPVSICLRIFKIRDIRVNYSKCVWHVKHYWTWHSAYQHVVIYCRSQFLAYGVSLSGKTNTSKFCSPTQMIYFLPVWAYLLLLLLFFAFYYIAVFSAIRYRFNAIYGFLP